jgi:septal ring factor EnvC (AmiA/AmiB activator)
VTVTSLRLGPWQLCCALVLSMASIALAAAPANDIDPVTGKPIYNKKVAPAAASAASGKTPAKGHASGSANAQAKAPAKTAQSNAHPAKTLAASKNPPAAARAGARVPSRSGPAGRAEPRSTAARHGAEDHAGKGNVAADSETVDPEQAQALREENASQRQQLKARLDELRQEISAGEATRSEAADALASSEQAISDANRRLHELSLQQISAQADLGSINQKKASASKTIAAQQAALAKLLHDQYLGGGEDPFKLLFSGDNPNRIARDFEYLGYVSRAQAAMLADLQQSIANLDDLSQQAIKRSAELDAIGSEVTVQRGQLLADQDNRKATLAAISEKLQSQRAEAGNLERDDARLAKVVDELSKLIERQAKERAERQRLAQLARDKERARLEAQKLAEQQEAQRAADAQARLAESGKSTLHPNPANPPPVAIASTAPDHIDNLAPPRIQDEGKNVALGDFEGHFARMKGSLRLPAKGELLSRFGATRSGGGPSWKGLFIQTPSGAEVHAVAPGRVVFAEWLRGFGNLLIIDHGDQYLSVYGNNESLLKQPGDVVQTGDLVATAGNSGGNPETGLYFELRYQGKPFDPIGWTTGH